MQHKRWELLVKTEAREDLATLRTRTVKCRSRGPRGNLSVSRGTFGTATESGRLEGLPVCPGPGQMSSSCVIHVSPHASNEAVLTHFTDDKNSRSETGNLPKVTQPDTWGHTIVLMVQLAPSPLPPVLLPQRGACRAVMMKVRDMLLLPKHPDSHCPVDGGHGPARWGVPTLLLPLERRAEDRHGAERDVWRV